MLKFSRSVFGYKRIEVDEAFTKLKNQLEAVRAELVEVTELKKHYESQQMGVSGALVNATQTAQLILEKAENEARTLEEKSKQEADKLIASANEKAEQTYKLLHKQLHDFEYTKSTMIEYEARMKRDMLDMMNKYIEKVKLLDIEYQQSDIDSIAGEIDSILGREKESVDQGESAVKELLEIVEKASNEKTVEARTEHKLTVDFDSSNSVQVTNEQVGTNEQVAEEQVVANEQVTNEQVVTSEQVTEEQVVASEQDTSDQVDVDELPIVYF